MKTMDKTRTTDRQVCVPRISVSQTFGFSASHELRLLPMTHKCRRNHGHNYTVTASAFAPDSARGDLSALGDYLASTFDHRLLNDQVGFHPTSELLVSHLAEWFTNTVTPTTSITLAAMELSETESTSARCDGATGAVTIAKRFATHHGDVTVVLGADELDEFGFVADFGDLKPFATYLRAPRREIGSHYFSPVWLAHIADWFVATIEPRIHGRLLSVRIDSGPAVSRWERDGLS